MTKNSTLIAGVFGAFVLSWIGLVAVPYSQIGSLQPQVDEDAGTAYPINVGGVMEQGRAVYEANGCIYCHTQQVRDLGNGSDIDRGWGNRRTVARDYIYEIPALGYRRYGPDLTNVGIRKPDTTKGDAQDKYTAAWHYKHLYDPRSTSPKSVMPPYRYLFEKRKISGEVSPDAVLVENGFEVIPKPEAKALVTYLTGLNRTAPLKEAPAQKEPAAK